MSKRPQWWLPVLARIWPITWNSARFVAWVRPLPVLGKIIEDLSVPLFAGKNLNVSYIPINQEIQGAQNSILPRSVVENLIRNSAHRVIINTCTCRDARQCENYPVDFGCLQLGEGTRQIDPRIARHVSVDEAIEHLDRGLELGLIPMVGRVKIDDLLWGVKDTGQLLAVCFCCRCCCTILNSGKYWPKRASDSIKRLKGLRIVHIKEACVSCGNCVDECFMGALSMGEVISINDDLCKGCGRCVALCPAGAMQARVDDLDAAVNELMGRIETLIDYGPPEQ